MALLSVGLVDYNGTKRRFTMHVEDGQTLTNYDLAGQTLTNQLDVATGMLIEEVTITLPLTVAGSVKGAPVDAIEGERGALLTFGTAGRYAYSTWVPGVVEAAVVGNSIDTDEFPGLITLHTAGFGPGFGDMAVHNGYGQAITALANARKTFRKS